MPKSTELKISILIIDGDVDEVGKELTVDGRRNRGHSENPNSTMATTTTNTFVDRIDPFAKRSLKKKQKKSQGSSRYHQNNEADLLPLPSFKGKPIHSFYTLYRKGYF